MHMKMLTITLALALLLIVSAACVPQAAVSGTVLPSHSQPSAPGLLFDSGGNYRGFADLPTDDSPEKALAAGCLVIDGRSGHTGSKLSGGETAWQAFYTQSAQGQAAFLRVAYFLDNGVYYQDLHYDGQFHSFECNPERCLLRDRPYRFLRTLAGEDGIPKRPVILYVLTDSLELTAHDVLWSFYSSDLNAKTKIPFEWLGFTTYLAKNDVNQLPCYSCDELVALIDLITQTTAEMPNLQMFSNPHVYIQAHQATYDRLVASGQDAVGCFTAILRQSETFGLDKYLMAAVCAEITGVGRAGGWGSAREWIMLYDTQKAK